jgi:ribosomal-protein-alanine N-acetyltransferase
MPRVRDARETDRSRIEHIQQSALDDPWEDLLAVAFQGPPLALVVTEDGADRPIGYAITLVDDPDAYVAEFAIEAGHRRNGHGTALMRAILDRLRQHGFETVRLTTPVDDDRARSFYESLGFEVVDRLPEHYDDRPGLALAYRLSKEEQGEA